MKTANISTLALVNATRETRVNLQVKLAAAQKESATGRHADVGLSLGYLTQRTVSLRQDLERLNTFKDTNAVSSSRLQLYADDARRRGRCCSGLPADAHGCTCGAHQRRRCRCRREGQAHVVHRSHEHGRQRRAHLFRRQHGREAGQPTISSSPRRRRARRWTTRSPAEFGVAQGQPGVENDHRRGHERRSSITPSPTCSTMRTGRPRGRRRPTRTSPAGSRTTSGSRPRPTRMRIPSG